MKKYISRYYIIRSIIVAVSIFFVGLGMSITRVSCMGTEPFSCLNYSISESYGISMGVTIAAINGILLLLDVIFLRESLGIGTIINMGFLGIAADFWGDLIYKYFGEFLIFQGREELILRFVLLCIGMTIMVFFSSIYMSCGVGMAPYDSLGYIVEKITGKIPYKWVRVISDCTCVVTAFLFASKSGTQWELIGIGTMIMAFFIGPLLMFFRKKAALPLIEKLC